jgi:hypothetical protein
MGSKLYVGDLPYSEAGGRFQKVFRHTAPLNRLT